VGVFLLNQHLDVIYANTAGRQVLARKDGIGTDQQTRLTATGLGTGSLRLEDWLARMVSLPKLERGGFDDTFDVARHKSKTRYSVQCCPLEPQDPLFSGEGAHHIVFVTDPQRLELPALAALQRQLGLTPAEARVTKALVQGGTYCEVAATMGVREETIRSQVKSVYAKTRTNTKAGLTRMVLSLSKATV
jgi:DNA-binding CsgD family transcriptional regulator